MALEVSTRAELKQRAQGETPPIHNSGAFVPISRAAAVPRTLRVTLVSPKVTVSNGALISQRYSPASSWVTLLKVTVAPSMLARPSKEPEGHVRRSGGLPQLQLILLLNVIIHSLDPFLSFFCTFESNPSLFVCCDPTHNLFICSICVLGIFLITNLELILKPLREIVALCLNAVTRVTLEGGH